jgi:DNA-binding cell septation regulator SpoVG
MIEVVRITPIKTEGNLKAFAVVRVDGFEVHSCRIVQQPGQKAFMSWPHTRSKDSWYPILRTPDRLRREVEAVVLEEWQKGGDKCSSKH